MKEIMEQVAQYLEELENNMLRNDADMIMDPCDPPSDWAEKIRDKLKEDENGNQIK